MKPKAFNYQDYLLLKKENEVLKRKLLDAQRLIMQRDETNRDLAYSVDRLKRIIEEEKKWKTINH